MNQQRKHFDHNIFTLDIIFVFDSRARVFDIQSIMHDKHACIVLVYVNVTCNLQELMICIIRICLPNQMRR